MKEQRLIGERMKQILRRAGYRATAGRVRLLSQLAQARAPLSIQRLARASRLNQANVYRALSDLARKHIVREVNLRHGHLDYELVSADDHHHVVCVRCGALEDIMLAEDGQMNKRALQHARGFATITDHAFEFFGVCERCARSKVARRVA